MRNFNCNCLFILLASLATFLPADRPAFSQSLEVVQQTGRAFRAAAARVQPSLVTIESIGGVGTRPGEIGGIRRQGEGNTTGVVLSADGYVVTSTFNFIDRPTVIIVVTGDGVRHRARMMGRDDSRKICLLKMDVRGETQLQAASIAGVDSIRVGQWAVSVGVGYGDQNPAISTGIISATNRVGGRAVQTDANISPANYGGPLIDIHGDVIGICVPLNPQSQAIGAGVEWYDSGIGFAIPIGDAESLIDRLKDPETRIYPAFLGIKTVPNPKGPGLYVQETVAGSAAADAGVVAGDIVVELDDRDASDLLLLRQILNRFESGQTATLTCVAADGSEKKVEVTFRPPPKPEGSESQLEPPEIR